MKKILIGILMWVAFAHFSQHLAQAADPDGRIWEATKVLDEVMAIPEQSIPVDLLAKAKAIAIFPSVVKAGFVIGARYGNGVVVSRDSDSGKWGAPAFFTMGGGSFGFQIGGSATDLVLVITNERGLRGLLQDRLTIGADVAATAGPLGRTGSISTDLLLKASIFSYSRTKGLFAGVSLEGAVISSDTSTNTYYYGEAVSPEMILVRREVKIPSSANQLIDALNKYSNP